MNMLYTMANNEFWADIPGFSKYEVSNMGRIRIRASGHIKALYMSRQGHRGQALQLPAG